MREVVEAVACGGGDDNGGDGNAGIRSLREVQQEEEGWPVGGRVVGDDVQR